ncbi:MAG: hypothetical protein ACYC1M_05765 [Armatimonadota bacterium]
MKYAKHWSANLALLLVVSTCGAAPVLYVPQLKSDAGVTNQGDPIHFSVEIFNKGDQPLRTSATSGCECGIADIEPVVPPHGMVLLKYLVKTDDMQGRNTRTVKIHSNDPKHPNITLSFSMDVRPAIWIEPSSAAVINLTADTTAKRTLIVKSADSSQIVLGEPQGLPQYCEAKLQGHSVFLAIGNDAPYGRSSFNVSIPVVKPKHAVVNASFTINKGIVMEPASIYLGSYASPLAKPLTARVIFNSSRPFKITGVKSPKELKASFKMERGNRWAMSVTLIKPIHKGVYRSSLVVSTDQPHQSKLEIPVAALRN